MKVGLLVALVVFAVHGVNGLLDGLNAWVELGLKFAGFAAAAGGAWKWLVGPAQRKVRAGVMWAVDQLRLIAQLDDRLDSIEEELTRGHEHFARLDTTLEALAAEEAQAIRRSLRTGDPVSFTEAGNVDRRESVPSDLG